MEIYLLRKENSSTMPDNLIIDDKTIEGEENVINKLNHHL